MKTPLAICNLWHQGTRTLVSIGGVAFALLLVFMQLGFMGAVSHTATNVLDKLKFNILIRARDYLHLYEPGQIDRKWLAVAESTDGVVSARPFWITIQNWRKLPSEQELQDDTFESRYLPIAVMAYRPEFCVFNVPPLEEQTGFLFQDNAVLLDDSTQADYGPWDGRRFSANDLARDTEIGGRQFVIRGLFQLGTGLAANGALVTSHHGFARITPWDVRRVSSLGLVEVEGDQQRIEEVLGQLRQRARLDSDAADLPDVQEPGLGQQIGQWLGMGPPAEANSGVVEILSRDEALRREKYRWLWQTPIGLIFQLGVLLSLLVGAAIVYMVLSTDVANRLPEYATLLAMGYSRKYLASIVMTQAFVLCAFGFLSAWGIAEMLYGVTSWISGIPLSMNILRVVLVAVLGLGMCSASGLLALRKLWKAEPASLF